MSSHDPILDAWDCRCRTGRLDPVALGVGKRATVEEVEARAREVELLARRGGLEWGLTAGLCAPNGPAFLAGLLGLRRLGCVVALLDWRAPRHERLRLAERLGCLALLVGQQAWPRAENWQQWTKLLPPEGLPALPAGTAVLKVTSGTSGDPQAVAASSDALMSDEDALARTMGLRDSERILAAIPMSHSYGFSSVALPAIVRGSQIVVPDEGNPFAPMQTALGLDVTLLPTVPAYLETLTRATRPPRAPTSLRLVITAGAPLRPETAVAFQGTYGHAVHVFYGASECGGITYDREGWAAERGTLGTPVEGVTVELEALEAPEPRDRGRVRVNSAAVAAGYYPRADSRLGGGSFLTSDVGAFYNGELCLYGRIDTIINVRGKKVDPVEVETVLRQLAGVKEVAVVGVPDGAGAGEVVRAVVVPAAGGVDAEALRAYCRERLAEHKVPRSIVFLPELPRTDRGKLDRQALISIGAAAEAAPSP